jgi:hypothetical protein
LAIARNFADSCGGSIDFLDSKVGTKISLRIPLIHTASRPSRQKTQEPIS